jgi:hypothetical protein
LNKRSTSFTTSAVKISSSSGLKLSSRAERGRSSCSMSGMILRGILVGRPQNAPDRMLELRHKQVRGRNKIALHVSRKAKRINVGVTVWHERAHGSDRLELALADLVQAADRIPRRLDVAGNGTRQSRKQRRQNNPDRTKRCHRSRSRQGVTWQGRSMPQG